MLFGPKDLLPRPINQAFTISTLSFLYILGVIHWSIFFNFGNISYETLDWKDGLFYYVAARDLVTSGNIPYFSDVGAPSWADHRFLGNPQSFLSPQIVLFPLMTIGQSILANTLIKYSLGFIGIVLLRNRYQLSIIPFTILFLLFNFNGHITSHISAGHTTWTGYYFLPFLFLIILNLLSDNKANTAKTAILLSLILMIIIMQGSFHIFIWCLLFLLIFGLLNPCYLKVSFISIFLGTLLSMFRLAPVAYVSLDKLETPVYASGYPTINTLLDALSTLNALRFEHVRNSSYNVGWHEQDIFIGFIGLAFIIFFGIYHAYSDHQLVKEFKFKALNIPMLMFLLLSFGFIFDIISDLRIPLISFAERVPSRFLIIPLVIIIITSAIRMEALLICIRRNTTIKFLILIGIVVLSHSLLVHSWFWKLDSSVGQQLAMKTDLAFPLPSNTDSFYIGLVNVSWAISLVSLLITCILYIKLSARRFKT